MVIEEILSPVEIRINSKWREMVTGSPVTSFRSLRPFGFIIYLVIYGLECLLCSEAQATRVINKHVVNTFFALKSNYFSVAHHYLCSYSCLNFYTFNTFDFLSNKKFEFWLFIVKLWHFSLPFTLFSSALAAASTAPISSSRQVLWYETF